MFRSLLLASAVIAGGVALSAVPAQASIIVSLIGAPTAVTGGTNYTYGATLSSDEQMDTSVQSVFFTLYDFGPATLGARTGLVNSNFAFTLNVNQPISAQAVVPSNNPSIADVRATYTGGVVNGTTLGSTPSNLGTFTLFTTYTGPFAVKNDGQDAQLEKYAPGLPTNDAPASNVSAITIPTIAASVPEPATMTLLGAGLLGLGMMRRKRA